MLYAVVLSACILIYALLKFLAARKWRDSEIHLVVLGSGGHTREMIEIVSILNLDIHKLCFICASGDKTSHIQLSNWHKPFDTSQTTEELQDAFPYPTIYYMPAPRAYGMFVPKAVLITVHSLLMSMVALMKTKPKVMLTNGPGVAVPPCYAAFILKHAGILDCRIIHVESLARVENLSLSGKLLYPIVDDFIVLWPQLRELYPKAKYFGSITTIE